VARGAYVCACSLQSRNACQQWLPVTLRSLPDSLTPMISQFRTERRNHCSLFGLISVLTVAKTCGCDVPWVSHCSLYCDHNSRQFSVRMQFIWGDMLFNLSYLCFFSFL